MGALLAYGDSNTWGLKPGLRPYQRYPKEIRWTGILQKKAQHVRVLEEGLCGRTTVYEDRTRAGRKGINTLPEILAQQDTVDSAILMLGTNDCKEAYGATSNDIGSGIEQCLEALESRVSRDRILLISPIALGKDVWKPEKDPEFSPQSVETSKALKATYEEIARRRGVHFLAASDYVVADEADDEHLNETGHRIFANVVYQKLKEMEVL
ncbi:MAG: arylesterase [Lachnospiraceae bacterium]|nr:arylesterase [Lachnospiraceae bacterium]